MVLQDPEDRSIHFLFVRKFPLLWCRYVVVANVRPQWQGEGFQVLETGILFDDLAPSLRPANRFCGRSVLSEKEI